MNIECLSWEQMSIASQLYFVAELIFLLSKLSIHKLFWETSKLFEKVYSKINFSMQNGCLTRLSP